MPSKDDVTCDINLCRRKWSGAAVDAGGTTAADGLNCAPRSPTPGVRNSGLRRATRRPRQPPVVIVDTSAIIGIVVGEHTSDHLGEVPLDAIAGQCNTPLLAATGLHRHTRMITGISMVRPAARRSVGSGLRP